MKTLAAVAFVSGLAIASAAYAQGLLPVFNGEIDQFHTGVEVVCAKIKAKGVEQWYWAPQGTSQAIELQLYYHLNQTIPYFQTDASKQFTCHIQGEDALAWRALDFD